jgi:hypothetical protein
MDAKTAQSDLSFWETEAGLLERAALLGDKIQLGAYNLATKLFGFNAGADGFQISGELGPNSCQWCIMHVGKVYPAGQFLPSLPKHPHCVHYYVPVKLGGGMKSLWWLLPWALTAELERQKLVREEKSKVTVTQRQTQ